MKVVQVSSREKRGGAARAANRIHNAVKKTGINSGMLVQEKFSDIPEINSIAENKFQKGLVKLRALYDKYSLMFYRNREKVPFSLGKAGVNISKRGPVKESDIVHLHWINRGFLSIKNIGQLERLNKPVVWTLHDQWAFTGGCHYSGECKKYKNNCGKCPLLDSSWEWDLSRNIWRKKKKAYKNLELTVVTPSNWLAEKAKESSLLKNCKVNVIPNPLNTELFKTIEKQVARDILNLPSKKHLILFGALNAGNDKRKGGDYLVEALKKFDVSDLFSNQDVEMLVFGTGYSEKIDNFSFPTTFLGHLYDNYSLALCYSAADVFVAPSIQEVFGQTISEAMACGTPVVAFNNSGPAEIIEHKKTGYLADYRSQEDLSEGIKWILSKKNTWRLSENARNKVLSNYAFREIGKKYKRTYESLLDD